MAYFYLFLGDRFDRFCLFFQDRLTYCITIRALSLPRRIHCKWRPCGRYGRGGIAPRCAPLRALAWGYDCLALRAMSLRDGIPLPNNDNFCLKRHHIWHLKGCLITLNPFLCAGRLSRAPRDVATRREFIAEQRQPPPQRGITFGLFKGV